MPIDDPVRIAISQAEDDLAAANYLPAQLVRMGCSAFLASKLAAMPAVAQLVTGLLSIRSTRFEKRLLCVAEELNAEQKRLENKIPDQTYYESEEFQTLLGLVLERIDTTHEQDKLRMFGDALANSGNAEFESDDKEQYVRILRDLSGQDLKILNHENLKGWLPHTHTIQYDPDILSSLSRLAGMGLVNEKLEIVALLSAGRFGSQVDAAAVLEELLTKPPKRMFFLSPFGRRFLDFIASSVKNDM